MHGGIAGVRAAIHADDAIGPRLRRQPFGHLVGIVGLGPVVVSPANAEGLPVAAAGNLYDDITIGGEGGQVAQAGRRLVSLRVLSGALR